MKNILTLLLFINVLLFFSCKPEQEDAIDLAPIISNPTFTITEKAGAVNTYVLESTTAGAFLYNWELGDGTTASGDRVEVYYQFMGDYEVVFRAFNEGGFGETRQTIAVAADDAAPCPEGSLIEFLTGCGDGVWKLAPEAGAYFVGPDDGSGTTWWASGQSDVDARPCAFNDEWIFNVDAEMIYDTKGDLWAEDYMGYDFECVADADLTGPSAVWASGTHSYETVEGTLEQLTVNGLGAFLGLPKATNGAEVTEPVSSITYDIVERSEDNGQKRMTLEVSFGAGLWRFLYISE